MSESLAKMKRLLEIDDTDVTKDEQLLHYYQRAKIAILHYCNVNELPIQYEETIVDYAKFLYKNRNSEGLSQIKQGERSTSYELGIPLSIRSALPLPKIKVGYSVL
ncbi:DNA-packaging protein [Ureibacillus massiliensis 4400831 = CIP 108448 = CCUG 49529]|uniref:DNA-packaging protein n=1 Tax=Ureibacillus massiliensis 4400831 = CIP 108448 = CCUG 49529 TaxID=1211035 RepID=A0A0A3IZH2_9BACL|nr:phage head-tail connector protein [Ureibacillus massiliensis]KGR90184.1 DNA-packaging protein [Ureibacillus massiliensis 4400831 = CIP 108448 = CCUG 49529]